jgi:hypothetical protein
MQGSGEVAVVVMAVAQELAMVSVSKSPVKEPAIADDGQSQQFLGPPSTRNSDVSNGSFSLNINPLEYT